MKVNNVYNNNTYKVRVLGVYDGDTFTGEVDLGFHVKIVQKFRLAGIDTPELKGALKASGEESRAFTAVRLDTAKEVLVKTSKTEKYGRYVATVFYDGTNLNDELVKSGMAKRVKY